MRNLIITALAAILIAGCRDAGDPSSKEVTSGFFITTTGEHQIVRESVTFTVFASESGKLNYRFARKTRSGSGSSGPAEASVDPDAPWFAYVETSRRIWVCDGRDMLSLLVCDEEGAATYSVTHPCTPGPPSSLIEQIPVPVHDRLPEVVRVQIESAKQPSANIAEFSFAAGKGHESND